MSNNKGQYYQAGSRVEYLSTRSRVGSLDIKESKMIPKNQT